MLSGKSADPTETFQEGGGGYIIRKIFSGETKRMSEGGKGGVE
jgi:hypothetical protein